MTYPTITGKGIFFNPAPKVKEPLVRDTRKPTREESKK